jgi:hypothetical protein
MSAVIRERKAGDGLGESGAGKDGAGEGTAAEKTDYDSMVSAWKRVLGVLGAAVCHDLNNPLQGVVGFLDLVLHSEQDTDKRRDLDYVLECGLHCREIADELGRMVERFPPQYSDVDVRRVLEAVGRACGGEHAVSAPTLEMEVAEEVETVRTDDIYLYLIASGLISGAFRVAGPGGRVSVAVEPSTPEELTLRVSAERNDPVRSEGGAATGDQQVADPPPARGLDLLRYNVWFWLARRAARLLGGRLEGGFSSGSTEAGVHLPRTADAPEISAVRSGPKRSQ